MRRFYRGDDAHPGCLALTVLTALLAGCDPSRRIGEAGGGRLDRERGAQAVRRPGHDHQQADGSRVFEYPRQPEGWTNYRITIGADGKMSSLRQLLNADNFCARQARPGPQRGARAAGPAGGAEALRPQERGSLGVALQAGERGEALQRDLRRRRPRDRHRHRRRPRETQPAR